MKLQRVYVRFFRSFNFDYERKAHPDATPAAWEQTSSGWYPFVRLDVDPTITAIVGANESGKSHLLDAIEKLLSNEAVDRQDFCRYSDLYSVEFGERRVSDFAGLLATDDPVDAEVMASLGYTGQTELYYIRSGSDDGRYVFTEKSPTLRKLNPTEQAALQERFPVVFRLRTNVALPASLPVQALGNQIVSTFPARATRRSILSSLPASDASDEDGKAFWQKIKSTLLPAAPATPINTDQTDNTAGIALGRDLLLDVAKIDAQSFVDLDQALAHEREGEVDAIIQRMNDAIAKHLNFPKWWAQDPDFQLMLSPREYEVAFTVRDRTETEYSFGERSRGLQYFLSYYVQLRANHPPEGRRQLLLLDEPDAYLSGVGQQDLLRILEEFALPEDGSTGGQVIYVTHSPYLINRNAAHRIRVLDKGSHEEGTRVVTDASRNHYEPLRSSLGPFVAETAFIAGANLFVEGVFDQVLLAGISSTLRAAGAAPSQTLNLNEITIVPAGSASAIPYMVYLARGRDEVKPPCVVLLDGDTSGREADRRLRKNPAGRRAYLDTAFILRLDQWAETASLTVSTGVTVEEPEDLILAPIAAAAARSYATGVLAVDPALANQFSSDVITTRLSDTVGIWDAVTIAFGEIFHDEHIEKIGFARAVITVLNDLQRERDDSELNADATATRANFAALLGHLSAMLRDARNAEDDKQQRNRVDRLVRGFLQDHPHGVFRDKARQLFHDLQRALDDTDDGDRRRLYLAEMRRRYQLDSDPLEQVPDWVQFTEDLSGLRLQQRYATQDRPTEPQFADETNAPKGTDVGDAGPSSIARPARDVDQSDVGAAANPAATPAGLER